MFAWTEERERSPKTGAKRKKAVISARCPPPPKQHHRRRTNVVRVQKQYAFHPNPRVPFAFHLREKAKLASSFLREQLSLSRVRKLYGHGANLYAKERKREKQKVCIRERAFTSFSLDSRANEIRSLVSNARIEGERGERAFANINLLLFSRFLFA